MGYPYPNPKGAQRPPAAGYAPPGAFQRARRAPDTAFRHALQHRRRNNRSHQTDNPDLMKMWPFLTPFVRTGPT